MLHCINIVWYGGMGHGMVPVPVWYHTSSKAILAAKIYLTLIFLIGKRGKSAPSVHRP